MMKLLISLTSPYARSARLAVAALELETQVDMQTVNHRGFDDALLSQNPLGKVPTLTLEDGTVLFDSRVVVDYLYAFQGKSEYLFRGADRFQGQTNMALATGLMDCTIAAAVEKRNHEDACQNVQWIERQEGKVMRALAYLEKAPLSSDFASLPSADQIFMASALGYLDFMIGEGWKKDHPVLAKWLQDFADSVPAFELTVPQL
ncbi:MAG TPA: glutathione S-transferase [Rhizobiales bacterium]|nr:glutathione S-transferase [Hyphomicrobiales bacterium]